MKSKIYIINNFTYRYNLFTKHASKIYNLRIDIHIVQYVLFYSYILQIFRCAAKLSEIIRKDSINRINSRHSSTSGQEIHKWINIAIFLKDLHDLECNNLEIHHSKHAKYLFFSKLKGLYIHLDYVDKWSSSITTCTLHVFAQHLQVIYIWHRHAWCILLAVTSGCGSQHHSPIFWYPAWSM